MAGTTHDFGSSKFDPNDYVKNLASGNVGLAQLEDARERVQALADKNDKALKANVFRNYSQYIETSKEISKLEAEMYELDHLMMAQNTSLAQMNEFLDGNDVPGFEDQEDRVSLSQLTTLKASDPLLAGESTRDGNLIQLDSQMDERNRTHAFLLPLSFVTAVHTASGLHLDAIEPLSELQLQPDAQVPGVKHAFALTGPSRQCVYLAQSADDQRLWVSALRRALRLQQAKDKGVDAQEEGEQEQSCAEEEQIDESWLHDAPEDLDVYVAQRAFNEAVDLSIKARNHFKSEDPSLAQRAAAHKDLRERIEYCVSRLIAVLCAELERPALQKEAVRATVQQLLLLDEPDKAMHKFISNWSAAIRRDFRKLKMEGSTELFIFKLARIFFAAIRATCREFDLLFAVSARSTLSGWVLDELEYLTQIFGRQVLQSSTTSFRTVAECYEIVCNQCRSVLDIGLDLEFVLWRLLLPGTLEAINEAGRNWTSTTAHNLVDESWKGERFEANQRRKDFLKQLQACAVKSPDDYLVSGRSKLFKSTFVFCINAYEFTQSAIRILNETTIHVILSWMHKLYTLFIERLVRSYDHREDFHVNATFLFDQSLAVCARTLEKRHGGRLDSLKELTADVAKTWQQATSDDGVSHI